MCRYAYRMYSAPEVAAMAGVSQATLLRWLSDGRVEEPSRDRRGSRVFSRGEAEGVVAAARAEAASPAPKGEAEPILLHRS